MKNFWEKLKRPVMATAPMSGVSDEIFRLMFLKYGKPSVFWTEFVSVDGLLSKKGGAHALKILKFNKKEKPIVAQIFGANPENFEKAGKIIAKLGYSGIDINMGCPDRDVEKRGGGSALIKNPQLAKQIIRATKKGAGELPVSVKTRIGYSKNEINTWITAILEEKPAVLTVHFRTKKEGYLPPAHWELAKEIIKLRDKISPKTLILGNGDVKTFEQAKILVKENKLDGIMVGRALIGNPWFFAPRSLGEVGFPTAQERLKAILEHSKLFDKLCKEKHWDSIKKHFHSYTKNFRGAKELRESLMKTKNTKEVKALLQEWALKN